ncbi:MAG: patatin-like phospholipase family protein [Legionellales bacterium]|nr:patatin-like phospholipase family protein [Legionellales bacterium]
MPKKKLKFIPNSILENELLDLNIPYDPLRVIQRSIKPQYLVFEGGGVKGIAYVGALEELEKNKMLSDVQSVAGSSAGGLTAFLLGLGHTCQEIRKIMEEINFEDFVKDSKRHWFDICGIGSKVKKIYNLLAKDTHGLSSGEGYTRLLENILLAQFESKFGNLEILRKYFKNRDNIEYSKDIKELVKGITFSEFDRIKEDHKETGFIDMKFTGTNLTQKDRREVIFGKKPGESPNFSIVKAARITGSFPGMFAAVPVDNPQSGKPDLYVDGGVSNNFPTDIYDDIDYVPEGYELTNLGANPAMLGFLIDDKTEMKSKIWGQSVVEGSNKRVSLKNFIKKIIEAMQVNKYAIKRHEMHIIQIDDQDIQTLQFNLSKAEINKLVYSGKKAAGLWNDLYHADGIYNEYRYKNLKEKYSELKQGEIVECFDMFIKIYNDIEENIKNIWKKIRSQIYKKTIKNRKKTIDYNKKILINLGLEKYLPLLNTSAGRKKLQNFADDSDKIEVLIDKRQREKASSIISHLLHHHKGLLEMHNHLNKSYRKLDKVNNRLGQIEKEIFTIFRIANIPKIGYQGMFLRDKYEEYVSNKNFEIENIKRKKYILQSEKANLEIQKKNIKKQELISFDKQLLKLDIVIDNSINLALDSFDKNSKILDNLIKLNREIIVENYKTIEFLKDDIEINKLIKNAMAENKQLVTNVKNKEKLMRNL